VIEGQSLCETLPGIDRRLKVTATEIAELAVELCQLSGCQNASYSDAVFKQEILFYL